MKQFLVVIPLIALCTFATAQQAQQTDVKETQNVASNALGSFRQMAGEGRFKDLGFESADEVSSATLGEPLPIFLVRLDDLRVYQAGGDAEKLLKPLNKVIYPVSAGGHVRSSIVVEKNNEGWSATNFGRPNLIKLLTDARQKISSENQLVPGAHFAVQIPALNAYFIGYRVNGKLMLASIVDDPSLKLSAAKSLPAEQVFADLVRAAKEHDDLPR